MALWSFPYADTINEPLVDAWWIPGFTSQAPGYIYAANPLLSNGPGFPSDLSYVTVGGSYYDTSGNPLSGYLTFWPSSPLTFNIDGTYTYMPQRYSGLNFSLIGINQMGDGKIYLQFGRLLVSLLATDNVNMTPSSFTYHVRENYQGGNQYDITAPSVDDDAVQDIRSLIIPGTIQPLQDNDDDNNVKYTSIPVTSTQYIYTDVNDYILFGMGQNLTGYSVYFAFVTGTGQPASDDWIAGTWVQNLNSNVAQILVGPEGTVLAAGSYRVWVQVNATPQQVVIPAGFLNIY